MRTHVLCILAGIAAIASPQAQAPIGFSFADVAREAGLTAPTVYGGQTTNKFLLETTGCGVEMVMLPASDCAVIVPDIDTDTLPELDSSVLITKPEANDTESL